MPASDYSTEDRWQAWCGAYVALCERICDQARGKPGEYGAASPATLRDFIAELRRLGEIEPPQPGLIVTLVENRDACTACDCADCREARDACTICAACGGRADA